MFAGKAITSNMAPEEAVQNIKSLLISKTEKGSQDHCSLLECYKLFDKYLTNSGRNSGGAGGATATIRKSAQFVGNFRLCRNFQNN